MEVDIDFLEKALLLNVIRNKDWKLLIKNNMDRKFISPTNLKLYDYIADIVKFGNDYPDIKSVQYEFQIDDVLLHECLSVDNLSNICDTIKKAYVQEYIIAKVKGLNQYTDELIDDPSKYIERMGAVCDEGRLLTHKVQSVDLFEDIDKQLGMTKEVISTGFKELDEKLRGWQRGEELVVFMGRTGQGKSWLGLKFAMAALEQGERVGIYSGEMSKEQLQERILCCAKRDCEETKEETTKYVKERDFHMAILTQRELRKRADVNDIESFIIDNNLTMVIVDQLSLMEDCTSAPNAPLRQKYGNISMDLFMLSSKYNLPVILLVQSNRQGGENKDGPALENIAESDAVAQNATRVISMKNEGGLLTLNILKNRYGDGNLIQRYDVNYGQNKYKPIKELNTEMFKTKRPTRSSTPPKFTIGGSF